MVPIMSNQSSIYISDIDGQKSVFFRVITIVIYDKEVYLPESTITRFVKNFLLTFFFYLDVGKGLLGPH